jgi:hypothetical protein
VDHRDGPSALADVVVMAGGVWIATGERLDVAGLDLAGLDLPVWAMSTAAAPSAGRRPGT